MVVPVGEGVVDDGPSRPDQEQLITMGGCTAGLLTGPVVKSLLAKGLVSEHGVGACVVLLKLVKPPGVRKVLL